MCPRAWILPFLFKTDMYSLKQNLCLAPNQKMVRTKKVSNHRKINLASQNFFSLFHVKKRTITYEVKSSCSVVFSTRKGLLECKPEWNREAVTVFSRLPSLLAWGDCKPLLHYKLPYSNFHQMIKSNYWCKTDNLT